MMLPFLLALLAAAVVFLPQTFETDGRALARRATVAALLGMAAVWTQPWAYLVLAASVALQAWAARSRTGTRNLALVGILFSATGAALVLHKPEIGFGTSIAALALTAGTIPLHVGPAALAERQPALHLELAGTALVAAFLHLRFAVLAAPELADTAADGLVAWGALAALVGALLALAQRTLRGLWSTCFTMHAGMLMAAIGAAGRGHLVGAVFVAVTLALALGGFGATVLALEARTGPIDLGRPGGRVRHFPVLAAAFAFFAAAGIALPGTAGFIADDLLLHALWEESPLACGAVLTASATLAIALLRGFSDVFLGPEGGRLVSPDLRPRERAVVVFGMVTLLGVGVFPMGLIGLTGAFFP